MFILGIHGGNIPSPKITYQVFFVFLPRIIRCYKKLTITMFNFSNINSRLPASSQHHSLILYW